MRPTVTPSEQRMQRLPKLLASLALAAAAKGAQADPAAT